VIAGLVAPGASQIVYTWSVRTAGASRTGILIGAAPVVAALLAIVLLDEPFKIALAVGTVAIVMGTAALVGERDREVGLRLVGTLFGLLTAVFFGLSAVALRWAATESEISPLVAATVTLGAGAAVNIVAALPFYLRRARLSTSPVNYLEPLLRSARAFLAAGALLGLAYLTLLEAFERGRVTVVSPLTATEIIASASCRVASATDSRTAARWSWLSLITRILTDRIVRPPPSTTA
jgi:drug/metabolite transporter (DMT)-like permease